jgi:hypothetical protein
MAKYEVQTTLLDRVGADDNGKLAFKDDGTPKKIHKHNKGDIIEFPGYDDDDLKRLVDLKAIKPVSEKPKEEGGGKPAAAPAASAGAAS